MLNDLLNRAVSLQAFGLGLVLLTSPLAATATDGVAEINQACAVMTGCFSGDPAGYPVAIDGSAGRSYVLTSDLILPDLDTGGILFVATDITIDLNGFSIRGINCASVCNAATGGGTGIRGFGAASAGASIKNGSVAGMGLDGVRLDFDGVVSNLRVRSCGLDGIRTGVGSKVQDNLVQNNLDNGVEVSLESYVSGNTITGNAGIGIRSFGNSSIVRNSLSQNELGIVCGDHCIISENNAFNNTFDGINTDAGSTVIGNSSTGNGGDGIETDQGGLIQQNVVRANTGFGLQLSAGDAYSNNVITSNTAGTVTGGVNVIGNSCNGTTTCP